MSNPHEIIPVLEEIATLLELQGENVFKVSAYRKAASALENLDEDLKLLVDEQRLGQLPGIGKALAEKISELVLTGKLPYYEELKAQVPEGVLQMLDIPGLGAKKARVLWEKLEVTSCDALQKACEEGRVAQLKGFGKKTEENILTGIRNLVEYNKRHLFWQAMQIAEPLLDALRSLPFVAQADIAGSLRRRKETVRDIDFLVAAEDKHVDRVMDWFTSMPAVARITGRGDTKASVRLEGGCQADLRVVPPAQYPFALLHFTGSKEHNVALRKAAQSKGWTLNEYGLTDAASVEDESALYKKLGLAAVPPELREDLGEIEAAQSNSLPQLVRSTDIRGVFHNHTVASDGRNTLEEMAAAAASFGWEYLGISDHSKSSVQANGLSEERLAAQIEQIRALNESPSSKVHLFAGTECDILGDGTLDFDEEVLRALDYVVVSVHSRFGQSEKEMTARIIRAIEHPCTTMLGHLTGRLLLKREPYAVNIPKIIDAAIANGVIIEINANPRRLDMDWRHWHAASRKGLMTSINPDAHSIDGLKFYEAGVHMARKGWLEKSHVFNTRSLEQVQELLQKRQVAS